MPLAADRGARRAYVLPLATALLAAACVHTGPQPTAPPGRVVTVEGLDSTAIAAAMAAALPGDTVKLGGGTYTIDRAIALKSGVRLLGAGQGRTLVRFAGKEPSVLLKLSGCEDAEAAHLTLDGEMSPKVLQGIAGGNSRRLSIHHVTIRNLVKTKTFGPHGILFSGVNPTGERGVTDSVIADCTLENIGVGAKFGCGIRLAWGSSRNQVLRNTVRTTGRGGIFGDSGSSDLVIRGNTVSGSGGEALGIEVWGRCERCVIEDNRIDHWLSIGGCNFCAARRNTVSDVTEDAKFCGIEAIGSHLVVTDNVVDGGQKIGISVSAKMPKQYVYYGGNTVRRCVQWGAQFQGEKGGIAFHYLYRCEFSGTLTDKSQAWYPNDQGHGFRTNGHAKHMVFEECTFRDNGGYGLQLGGPGVDGLSFVRCTVEANKGAALVGLRDYTALEWVDCVVEGNRTDELRPAKPFPHPPPVASFDAPRRVRVGEPARLVSTSRAARGKLSAVLWDFGDGPPSAEPEASHVYSRPGTYRVTLIVWDEAGRGARAERAIRVRAAR